MENIPKRLYVHVGTSPHVVTPKQRSATSLVYVSNQLFDLVG
jgi:hypothetical protein